MISAGFVHLLGAALKELDSAGVFPVAPFLCGLGFIMTLIADHWANMVSERSGWGTPLQCHAPDSVGRGAQEAALGRDTAILRQVALGPLERQESLQAQGACGIQAV